MRHGPRRAIWRPHGGPTPGPKRREHPPSQDIRSGRRTIELVIPTQRIDLAPRSALMSASITAKRHGTARSPRRRLNPDTSGIRRRSRYRGSRQEARRPDDEHAVEASKSSSLGTRDAPNVTVDMRVVGGADSGRHGVTIFKVAGQGKIMG